jgi:hypothetical protein
MIMPLLAATMAGATQAQPTTTPATTPKPATSQDMIDLGKKVEEIIKQNQQQAGKDGKK